MPSWQGKTRGGVTGYKIFVHTLKFFGVGAAYFLLRFVIIYYFLFAPNAVKSAHYYFHRRQQFGFWKSLIAVYKNIYAFGQTLIDKVAILSGLGGKFTYNFENENCLR
jgi:predicted LPLAT superfamily acyltransferase